MRTLTIIFLIALLTGCESKKRKTPEYKLRQLVNVKEDKYQTSTSRGFYFLIGGSFSSESGEALRKARVKMFVNMGGAYRMLDIRLEDIRVVINNNLSKPVLRIQYKDVVSHDADELVESYQKGDRFYQKYYIYCPEKYLPENLTPINL